MPPLLLPLVPLLLPPLLLPEDDNTLGSPGPRAPVPTPLPPPGGPSGVRRYAANGSVPPLSSPSSSAAPTSPRTLRQGDRPGRAVKPLPLDADLVGNLPALDTEGQFPPDWGMCYTA